MTPESPLPEEQTLFPQALLELAAGTLAAAREAGIRLATAETVTAGLISACLTSVAGASETFERGFVLYHSSAKATGLGVSEDVAARYGAVSAEVTRGLAEGVLRHSQAGAAVAITGYAGPAGGNERNPVGTVYIAAARRGMPVLEERYVFSGGRDSVKLQGVAAAIKLLRKQIAA
jgi:nicotinamide-nucleotide amidase